MSYFTDIKTKYIELINKYRSTVYFSLKIDYPYKFYFIGQHLQWDHILTSIFNKNDL